MPTVQPLSIHVFNPSSSTCPLSHYRYYLRALCRRAIEEYVEELIVYRAKPVREARPESEELVESTVNAQALLEDLREHTGDTPPAMGIPGGPNSGISVRLP